MLQGSLQRFEKRRFAAGSQPNSSLSLPLCLSLSLSLALSCCLALCLLSSIISSCLSHRTGTFHASFPRQSACITLGLRHRKKQRTSFICSLLPKFICSIPLRLCPSSIPPNLDFHHLHARTLRLRPSPYALDDLPYHQLDDQLYPLAGPYDS